MRDRTCIQCGAEDEYTISKCGNWRLDCPFERAKDGPVKHNDSLDREIKALEERIEQLKREKEAKSKLTDAQRIAILIHDTYDKTHDDSWDYNLDENGIPKWNQYPAKGYLDLANKQLTYLDGFMNPDDAYKTLKFIHESKRTLVTYR